MALYFNTSFLRKSETISSHAGQYRKLHLYKYKSTRRATGLREMVLLIFGGVFSRIQKLKKQHIVIELVTGLESRATSNIP